jgi:hypothetical protein
MLLLSNIKDNVEVDISRPFAVDIVSGRCQFLLSILDEAPGGIGVKMILQDRPEVLDPLTQEDTPNIEKMSYDFFIPQPVKSTSTILFYYGLNC